MRIWRRDIGTVAMKVANKNSDSHARVCNDIVMLYSVQLIQIYSMMYGLKPPQDC